MERRVVITGMGIWSCLGQNLNEVKESLYAGGRASAWNGSGSTTATARG